MASRQIIPNIQRRIYTDSSQTLPKKLRRRENSQRHSMKLPPPWYQNHKRHHHKTKLWAGIIDEYRCKNSQQNINRLNPATYKKIIYHNQAGFIIPSSQGWSHIYILINVICHLNNRQKPQDHLNIYRKSTRQTTHDKHPYQSGTEGISLYIEKTIYDEPTVKSWVAFH